MSKKELYIKLTTPSKLYKRLKKTMRGRPPSQLGEGRGGTHTRYESLSEDFWFDTFPFLSISECHLLGPAVVKFAHRVPIIMVTIWYNYSTRCYSFRRVEWPEEGDLDIGTRSGLFCGLFRFDSLLLWTDHKKFSQFNYFLFWLFGQWLVSTVIYITS